MEINMEELMSQRNQFYDEYLEKFYWVDKLQRKPKFNFQGIIESTMRMIFYSLKRLRFEPSLNDKCEKNKRLNRENVFHWKLEHSSLFLREMMKSIRKKMFLERLSEWKVSDEFQRIQWGIGRNKKPQLWFSIVFPIPGFINNISTSERKKRLSIFKNKWRRILIKKRKEPSAIDLYDQVYWLDDSSDWTKSNRCSSSEDFSVHHRLISKKWIYSKTLSRISVLRDGLLCLQKEQNPFIFYEKRRTEGTKLHKRKMNPREQINSGELKTEGFMENGENINCKSRKRMSCVSFFCIRKYRKEKGLFNGPLFPDVIDRSKFRRNYQLSKETFNESLFEARERLKKVECGWFFDANIPFHRLLDSISYDVIQNNQKYQCSYLEIQ
jgi:hypothetical protein